MRPRHLYVHVPFCKRRCSYCDFAVQATASPPVDAWLDATAAELRLRAGEADEPQRLDTLYVGGGTPSVLGSGAMARLWAAVNEFYSLGPDAEWTVEANPESFSEDLARDWAAAGVNRVSLGAQTFHAPAL
ncbi:MAG: radical SAM protein [Gemmatimonadota bacterium]